MDAKLWLESNGLNSEDCARIEERRLKSNSDRCTCSYDACLTCVLGFARGCHDKTDYTCADTARRLHAALVEHVNSGPQIPPPAKTNQKWIPARGNKVAVYVDGYRHVGLIRCCRDDGAYLVECWHKNRMNFMVDVHRKQIRRLVKKQRNEV